MALRICRPVSRRFSPTSPTRRQPVERWPVPRSSTTPRRLPTTAGQSRPPPLMHGVIAGATAVGARVVYADNLYCYGPVDGPLTEDLPARAAGPNGRVRAALAAQLMDADERGSVRAAIGRASDFYGPWGRQSTAGERLFVPALRGKATQVLGDPDLPHTFTYLGDFARGLATLGTHDEAFGQVWHVPSAETLTTREFIDLVYVVCRQPVEAERPAVSAPQPPRAREPDSPGRQGAAVSARSKLDRRPHQVRPGVRSTRDAPRRRNRAHARLVARRRTDAHICVSCPRCTRRENLDEDARGLRVHRRLHDRPSLAPRVTRSSSSCSNVSPIASAAPVPAASRASFEG